MTHSGPGKSGSHRASVKLYPGGRLYDTTRLRYVTAKQLRASAKAKIAFSVVDAATGVDVTAAYIA